MTPFGPRAWRLPRVDPVNVPALRALAGVRDVAVADRHVLLVTEGAQPPDPTVPPPAPGFVREHTVAVRYDGPDLAAVAAATGLPVAEVLRRHAAGVYTVRFLGFLPGFGYLEGLDPALRLPRRPSPRAQVPAGSVAIAGPYAGVYPTASPGGWHLLGRAVGFRAFDPVTGPAWTLDDVVRFVPTAVEPDPPLPPRAATGDLRIEALLGHVSVQDLGRPGHLHQGVPAGGATDPARLVAANRSLGNADAAGGLELVGALRLRAARATWLSVDGGTRKLRAGEALDLPAHPHPRWLAVEGGIATPLVLGSRGALPGVRLGAGDTLPLGAHDEPAGHDAARDTIAATRPAAALPDHAPTALPDHAPAAGPDLAPGSDDPLAGPLRIVALDRTGVRLAGPVPVGRVAVSGVSSPLLRGAVQQTPSGELLVLGPDHPVTGGYPVVAVLSPAAQARLATTALPGDVVRLRR